MQRRKFVKSALLSGSVLGGAFPLENSMAMNDGVRGKKQQWYELRTYLFANDAQRQLTDAYLQQAYLPALNRAGIKDVGVFSEMPAAPQPQGAAQSSTAAQPP